MSCFAPRWSTLSRNLPTVLTLAVLGSVSLSAQTVANSGDYVDLLATFNGAVDGPVGNTYSLQFDSGLTVTPGTRATINVGVGNTLNILGNGSTLSGANKLTALVIDSGTINISDATISGGHGQGAAHGPHNGGGAGLGGGLFIVSGATVNLHNVDFTGNSAQGGSLTSTPGVFISGNASFMLGLRAVDDHGVPTGASGKRVEGGPGGPAGNAGGQSTQGYVAGFIVPSSVAPGHGTTGSVAGGGGGGGVYLPGGVPAAQGGYAGLGGGTGGVEYYPDGWAAGGGGGLVGGAGFGPFFNEVSPYGTSNSTGGGGFGGGGGSFGLGYYAAGGGGFGGGGGGGAGAIVAGGGGFGGGTVGSDGLFGETQTTPGFGGYVDGASFGGAIFAMNGVTLTLSGSSTFAGNSVMLSGPADKVSSGALAGSDLFMMTGADVRVAPGTGETIVFHGTIADDSLSTLAGSDSWGSPSGAGAGAALKIGDSASAGGTVILYGASTYAGGTVVGDGTTLVANNTAGSATGTGGVVIGAGSTLGGSGFIGGLTTIEAGGHLAPGNSPGTLTFDAGLALYAGAILDFQLGTSSDLLRITGGVLSGPDGFGGLTLNLADAGGFDALLGGSFTLFDFTGATADNFDVHDFMLGTLLAGTDLSDYSFTLDDTTLTLSISAHSSPGTVPDSGPSTTLLAAVVFALAALARRRRQPAPAVMR